MDKFQGVVLMILQQSSTPLLLQFYNGITVRITKRFKIEIAKQYQVAIGSIIAQKKYIVQNQNIIE